MVKTYRIKCSVCGKSYQTDKERAKRINNILKKDPDYLKNYKCRACKRAGKNAQSINKKVQQIKKEVESFEFDEEMQQYIPKKAEKYINRKFGDVKDEDLILWHFKHENPLMKNLLFIGETGTGKNALINHVCYKYKIPHARFCLNRGITKEDLMGQTIMDEKGRFVFNYSLLIKFAKKGGIIVFDEINGADREMMFLLHGITDWARELIVTGNKGEVIKAVDNLLIIGCMNPPDEYGLQELNPAFRSRFIPIYFDYSNEVDKILFNDPKLIKFVNAIREARKQGEIETPLGTRDLMQYKLVKEGIGGYKLAKEMLINKFRDSEKSVVRTMIETYIEKSKVMDEKGGQR